MAEDFIMSVALTLTAQDAINQLKGVSDKSKEAGKDMSNMAGGAELSAAKLTAAFQFLSSVAGGIWDSMLETSPSLQVAMLEIDMALEEMYRTLGEALAPIIEETILPLIQEFVAWFMELNPETQKFIAVIVGLTVAMTALIPVVIGVIALIGALSWPILAVVAAVAALVYIFTTDFMGLRTLAEDWWDNGMKPIFEELSQAFGFAGDDFAEFWAVIEPIVTLIATAFATYLFGKIKNTFTFFKNQIVSIMELFGNFKDLVEAIFVGDIPAIIEALGGIFKNVFELTIGNALTLLKDNFSTTFTFFEDLFSGLGDFMDDIFGDGTSDNIGAAFEVIKSLLNSMIAWLNEHIVSSINNALSGIKDINIGGATPFDWIDLLDDIPSFQIGGMIPGNGEVPMIGHGGEEVLQTTNPRHIANIGTGGSGATFNNTFQITAKTGMDRYELQTLVDQISQEMERQMQLKGKF